MTSKERQEKYIELINDQRRLLQRFLILQSSITVNSNVHDKLLQTQNSMIKTLDLLTNIGIGTF